MRVFTEERCEHYKCNNKIKCLLCNKNGDVSVGGSGLATMNNGAPNEMNECMNE